MSKSTGQGRWLRASLSYPIAPEAPGAEAGLATRPDEGPQTRGPRLPAEAEGELSAG